MNVFGMGPAEILLILVLALIVFGPGKLPEIMGQIGRAVRDFQKATSELSNEFQRTLQAEVAETKAAVEASPPASRSAAAMPPGPVTAPEPRTNGAAEAAPPLADTSQSWAWEKSPSAAPDSPGSEGGEATAKRAAGSAPADEDLRPPY
jgi:TatA/E family protein of Tat protein translocase